MDARMVDVDKGTIVVVDDEANIADLVGMYLEREGFRVLKTATGDAGLEAFATHRPRLLVLDVGLPDIDGLEVCKRIRQTSQVPVIFLTARDSEVDRVLGLELGADDYLTKPFSPAELVARVKAVLRRRRRGTARHRAGRPRDGRRRPPRGPRRRQARRAHHQGVRPPALPRRAARGSRSRASRSSTASGASTGSVTHARSTCTSARYARSSGTRSTSRRSVASATASSRVASHAARDPSHASPQDTAPRRDARHRLRRAGRRRRRSCGDRARDVVSCGDQGPQGASADCCHRPDDARATAPPRPRKARLAISCAD